MLTSQHSHLLNLIAATVHVILASAILLAMTGCASMRGTVRASAEKISGPRLLRDLLGGDPEGLQIIERNFDKPVLEKLVAHPEITQVRLVRLVRPASITIVPEHRLLDISKEGPYSVLGFEPGDIVLACHGYIVENPIQFFRYLKALPLFESGSFDIVRKGKNIRIIVKVLNNVESNTTDGN